MMLGVLASAIRRASGGGTETDPYWGSVVALLHFDGDLVDQKGAVWTNRGAVIQASVKKFGEGSIYVDSPSGGSLENQARVDTPSSPNYHFGSGDFTVEAFVYPSSTINPSEVSYVVSLYSTQVSDPQRSWAIRRAADGQANLLLAEVPGATGLSLSGGKIPVETWVHLAVSRQSGTVRLFVGGVLVNSALYANSLHPSTAPLAVGAMGNGFFGFKGNIDEVRVTKGVARYTAGFTPPTKAFPDS